MHVVDVTFRPGAKTLLLSLFSAIKDFNPTHSINLVFTPRGLAVRFAAHPTDDRAVVAFQLDAGDAQADTRSEASSATGPAPSSPIVAAPPGFPVSGMAGAPAGITPLDTTRRTSVESSHRRTDSIAFQSYECRKSSVTIGINPKAFVQQLMLVDDEDRITIRAEESDNGHVLLYELYFESPDLGKKCLYELDAIPRVDRLGPLPRTKYAIVVQIASEEFARIVAALADTSDKVTIQANKNSITFLGTGADRTLQVGLVQKPAALGETIPRFKVLSYHATTRQTFDARYLRGFSLATPLSPSVVLHLGTGRTPLRVTYPVVVDAVTSPWGGEGVVLSTVGPNGGRAGGRGVGVKRHSSPAGIGGDVDEVIEGGRQQVVGQLHYVLYPEGDGSSVVP
ncbi:hypothetical protein HDV00_000784 [Rhizophlyctis rosea]|nr:hypothetical protein HDV00_000784 [Rhizophlyctis rosea]